MKRFNLIKHRNLMNKLALCILFLTNIEAYPTFSQVQKRPMELGERTYPNGTVVGKYAYLDKEGNPVQVKYYADDSSYGVELNSIKLVTHKYKPNTEALIKKHEEIPIFNTAIKENPFDNPKDFDFVNGFKYPPPGPPSNKYGNIKNKDYPEAPSPKNDHLKRKYKGPDYEVYTKNEIDNDNEQCDSTKEKVHVYNFVKEARKARDVNEDEEDAQFCEF